jgi:hypothetical protein
MILVTVFTFFKPSFTGTSMRCGAPCSTVRGWSLKCLASSVCGFRPQWLRTESAVVLRRKPDSVAPISPRVFIKLFAVAVVCVNTTASPPGSGFLAEVCRGWELSTEAASAKGIRVVNRRFGNEFGARHLSLLSGPYSDAGPLLDCRDCAKDFSKRPSITRESTSPSMLYRALPFLSKTTTCGMYPL